MCVVFFFLMIRRPPRTTLLPDATLFRSGGGRRRDDARRSFRNSRNDRRDSSDDRYSRGRRESATVTCADCGTECEVPFVPRSNKPVYCDDCFRESRRENLGDDRYSRNDRQEYRRDNRRESRRDDRFSRSKKESAFVTCADCGTECEIPFVPKTDRPVYCSDCFRKNKPQDNEYEKFSRDDRRESRRRRKSTRLNSSHTVISYAVFCLKKKKTKKTKNSG